MKMKKSYKDDFSFTWLKFIFGEKHNFDVWFTLLSKSASSRYQRYQDFYENEKNLTQMNFFWPNGNSSLVKNIILMSKVNYFLSLHHLDIHPFGGIYHRLKIYHFEDNFNILIWLSLWWNYIITEMKHISEMKFLQSDENLMKFITWKSYLQEENLRLDPS